MKAVCFALSLITMAMPFANAADKQNDQLANKFLKCSAFYSLESIINKNPVIKQRSRQLANQTMQSAQSLLENNYALMEREFGIVSDNILAEFKKAGESGKTDNYFLGYREFCIELQANNYVEAELNINLIPKYGAFPKNDAQKAADKNLMATVDERYSGNRKKASEDASMNGWQYLRQGNVNDAMRRFNQAWLLDNSNGKALWGMAAVQASNGKLSQSLKLFAEAEHFVGDDVDYLVDYARAMGFAGAEAGNKALIQEAFDRFAQLYKRAPQHTLNLQNWAITLFHVGDYAEAWKKVQLAEATPRHAELDKNFIAALQSKMSRP